MMTGEMIEKKMWRFFGMKKAMSRGTGKERWRVGENK